MAYHLELLEGSCLYDVFHVNLLNDHQGNPPAAPGVLPPMLDDRHLQALGQVQHRLSSAEVPGTFSSSLSDEDAS